MGRIHLKVKRTDKVPEKKIIVAWQNFYSIGIGLVDEQHKDLINLTNKLFESCLAGKDKTRKAFIDTVHEAVDYTAYHFSTEEKLMKRVNYPEFQHHKREHQEFVLEVVAKVEEFNSGKLFAPLGFVYFLRDWVLHHIAVSDKKMGNHLLRMKMSGELQKLTLKVRKDETTKRMLIQ